MIDVVALHFTRDAGGNTANPLRSTSLSPDGRLAAFPQPDSLVVVNLTDGSYTRSQVAGLNEQIRWLWT